MARKRRKEVSLRAIRVWKRFSRQLTPEQRRIRAKSLEALSLVRREGLGLREAAKRVGLDPQTIRANTNAFRKVDGRWKAKTFDRIPRSMRIYERGREVTVEIGDSRIASLIGEYHNRVKQFLETGKSSFLRELPRKRFKDIGSLVHTLETDPKAVFAIKEREPTPEFFEIYRW